MNRVYLAAVALIAAAAPMRVTGQAVTVPDTPAGHALEQLLEAYNSGELAQLRTFAETRIATDTARVEQALGYWNAVYREVGPLSLVTVGEDGAFWCRGRVTGAWIGIGIRIGNDPQAMVQTAVRRMPVPPRAAPPRPAVPERSLADSVGAFLQASADAGHFSGAVVISKGGEPIFRGAYGFADRDAGIRNTLDTRFKLASVTKMFTGVAISQLAERGLLAFDDPIRKYIPEYPEHIGRQVTIHHLLTHTSGIELDDDPEFNAAVARARSVEDLLAAQLRYIRRLNLGNYDNFQPLGRYDYTNEGIDLLGVIVERVSGQPWDDYLREHVFEPAGMTNSGATYIDPPPLAKAYMLRGDRLGTFEVGDRREVPDSGVGVVGVIRPAGSGYASPRDLVRFMDALFGGEILGEAYVRRMTSPQVDQRLPSQAVAMLGFQRSYGYTLDIVDYTGGPRAIGHTGGAPGVNTAVFHYVEPDVTVVIVSNFDRGGWWVQQRVNEMLLGTGE